MCRALCGPTCRGWWRIPAILSTCPALTSRRRGPMVPNGPRRDVIAGLRLTLVDVVRVARAGARVRLDPTGLERAQAAHALITHLAESGAPLYGITTGSGANRTIRIPPEELGVFQVHLITSHCVGVGPPLPADVVRALMLVRAWHRRGRDGSRPRRGTAARG